MSYVRRQRLSWARIKLSCFWYLYILLYKSSFRFLYLFSFKFEFWLLDYFSITLVVLLCYYRLVLKGYCLLFNVLLLIAEHVLYFSTAHYILSILFWNFFKVFLFIFLCCFLSFFAELFDILTPFFHLVNIFWKIFLKYLKSLISTCFSCTSWLYHTDYFLFNHS